MGRMKKTIQVRGGVKMIGKGKLWHTSLFNALRYVIGTLLKNYLLT